MSGEDKLCIAVGKEKVCVDKGELYEDVVNVVHDLELAGLGRVEGDKFTFRIEDFGDWILACLVSFKNVLANTGNLEEFAEFAETYPDSALKVIMSACLGAELAIEKSLRGLLSGSEPPFNRKYAFALLAVASTMVDKMDAETKRILYRMIMTVLKS